MKDRLEERVKKILERGNYPRSHVLIFLALGALSIIMAGGFFYFAFTTRELSNMRKVQPVVYYQIPEKSSFLDTEGLIENENGEVFEIQKKNLVEKKKSFIEVDLYNMKLTLYKDGSPFETYRVQSKGKEGSWWETTTGLYSVGSKTVNHFSSISKVWMPYGIQFYGNFFIHGWPYYSDGTPLPMTSSGGCMRLLTDDAKKVFNFADPGMPVLVFEKEPKPAVYTPFRPKSEDVLVPQISAESAIVADLDTGEILLDRNTSAVFSTGPLTKVMSALTLSEVVNLDRMITAKEYMLPTDEKLIVPETRYYGFDLLFPLLMQSSNGAASVLSGFLGAPNTIDQMNRKANAIGMYNTHFSDVSGLSKENTSTLQDLSKLAKYIVEKRSFVFELTRGLQKESEGSGIFKGIENLNPLVGEDGIFGSVGNDSSGNLITVWKFESRNGVPRHIFVGVLGAKTTAEDIKGIISWVRKNFSAE